MTRTDLYRDYLAATNELLLEFAREAKEKAVATRGGAEGDFNDGYLMGFHRVVSLMQQQADAFDIQLENIGLADIDANKDLIS